MIFFLLNVRGCRYGTFGRHSVLGLLVGKRVFLFFWPFPLCANAPTRPLVHVLAVVRLSGPTVGGSARALGLGCFGLHHFHVVGHVVYIGLILCHQVHIILLGHKSTSWLS